MNKAQDALPDISAAMLRDHPLFQGLTESTIELLAKELRRDRVQPGDLLMQEGDLASHMYVILAGEVEIMTPSPHGNVCVAILGPGDWLGEMSALEIQPRSASARALAPSLMLRITATDVRNLLQDQDMADYAQFVLNIARELHRRLRVADRLIANSGATMAQDYVRESLRPGYVLMPRSKSDTRIVAIVERYDGIAHPHFSSISTRSRSPTDRPGLRDAKSVPLRSF